MSLLAQFLFGSTLAFGQVFVPFPVTSGDVARELAADVETFDVHFGRLRLKDGGPGLRFAGYTRDVELPTARAFAEILHPQGFELILTSALYGLPTPAFSGLVLDRDQRVVANFRLLVDMNSFKSVMNNAEKAHKKIARYSANPGHFARLAFENTRTVTGHRRDADVDEVLIRSPRELEAHRTGVRAIQRALALFAPGRPTWLLVGVNDDADGLAHVARKMRGWTLPGRTLTRILLMQPSRVLTIQDCEIDLSPR